MRLLFNKKLKCEGELRLFSLVSEVNPLDESHRRSIAGTKTELNNAAVTTLTVATSWSDLFEESLYSCIVTKVALGNTARVNITFFTDSYHLFSKWAKSLSLCEGGADTLVFDEGAHLVSHHRLTVWNAAFKLKSFMSFSHDL